MAPFYSLVGNIIYHTAIIHDLNVVTTITTDGHYAGGMVGYVYHSASISNGGQAIAVALQGRTLYTDGRWNTLYYPNAAMTIGSCRALFRLGDNETIFSVRAFNLNFGEDSEETGIKDLRDLKDWKDSAADAWFTLDGRRLSGKPSQCGVYIHDGRKIAIQ